ncbi:MAG: hypothetical protein NXH75_10835 [Halobacteriovoraceae bacterium]|nr:hypothetical protein [Halobacteriovoraceae bacterium]
MNTTLIAMGIAALMAIGLVITVGVLSLLSGSFHFYLQDQESIFSSQNLENTVLLFLFLGTVPENQLNLIR